MILAIFISMYMYLAENGFNFNVTTMCFIYDITQTHYVTVFSKIFLRILFSRNFAYVKFREN